MTNSNFDFTAFSAVKNGQKIQTSTPILDVKGHVNKFGLNKAAMDLMNVDSLSNVVILANPTEGLSLGERYIIVVTRRKEKDEALIGARVMIKSDDESNNSGSFQYAMLWGQMQSDSLKVRSVEELYLDGVLVEGAGNKKVGKKNINFKLVLASENVPYRNLGIDLDGECDIFALTEPTEEAYVYRTIDTKKKKSTLKEVAEFDEPTDASYFGPEVID